MKRYVRLASMSYLIGLVLILPVVRILLFGQAISSAYAKIADSWLPEILGFWIAVELITWHDTK